MAEAFDPVFAGLSSPAKAWNRSGWHRRVPGYRVVVKDVAALMAAEWLAERFDPQILFIVRHPCAVILSELWQGTPAERSLTTILTNELLVEDHLRPYISGLREAEGEIAQLAAVWAVRHRVIADGLQTHPEWQVVYYEALCADPVRRFKQLFESLDLRWSEAMERYVEQHSMVDGEGMYSTKRVSYRQIDQWKGEIGEGDIARVREITRSLGLPFYEGHDEWTLAKFLR